MFISRVAVLRGGPSAEYAVSLQTGASVLRALSETNMTTKDIVISQNGEWLVDGYVRMPEQALADVDVAFIALHGAFGEDGGVQRVLERLSVPYTGSKPYASGIAFNKVFAKEHVKNTGVKLAPHIKLTRTGVSDPQKTAESITALFGPHYVIKPVSGGSSVDTAIAENLAELAQSIKATLARHEEVLVEQKINGREATVGVLENFRNEGLYRLPVVEIVPPHGSKFFDSIVKYDGTTEEICPGRFSTMQKQELADIAEMVHRSLQLRQYSRSDFIVAEDGIYFLEVNTLPGLTPESLYPKSIDAVGCSYKEFLVHLLTDAVGK